MSSAASSSRQFAWRNTGAATPPSEIARLAHARGALVHTDAAQSTGKIATDVNALGADLLSVAGHKLYAPKGVGGLFVRRGTPIHPLLLGAGHECGLRPGTENVASILGLGRACDVAFRDLQAEATRVRALRHSLWDRLFAAIPGLALNGHPVERLPDTINIRFPGVRGSAVLAKANQIAASVGSACHEGGESASPVLLAMGIEEQQALGSVRLSLGRMTSEHEIQLAAQILTDALGATGCGG